VIAHRTLPRHAPENSLEGMRRAIELGADAVEIDVRLTRDGVPVLLHDRTPHRTAGGWMPVRWTSAARLRRRRLANGEPVPTLDEALGELPVRLGLSIDIKHGRAVAATVDEVRRHRADARTRIWSRHLDAVRYAAEQLPDTESALLRDGRSRRALQRLVRDAVANGARAISAEWGAVTSEFAAIARSHGLKLYSWCKHVHPEPSKILLLDGIVTDWPTEVRAAIATA
jgi:glycerophosphoryl diester phosphodiesterase